MSAPTSKTTSASSIPAIVLLNSQPSRTPYPSWPLFGAIVATQVVAVLMCAYGVLVTALPWELIGFVWAYVIVWTILTDLVKLAYYRFGPPSRAAHPAG